MTPPPGATAGQVVGIDGKTLRLGFDKAVGTSAILVDGARAMAYHVGPGQVVGDAKGNEITAIPMPPDLPAIAGPVLSVVTLANVHATHRGPIASPRTPCSANLDA